MLRLPTRSLTLGASLNSRSSPTRTESMVSATGHFQRGVILTELQFPRVLRPTSFALSFAETEPSSSMILRATRLRAPLVLLLARPVTSMPRRRTMQVSLLRRRSTRRSMRGPTLGSRRILMHVASRFPRLPRRTSSALWFERTPTRWLLVLTPGPGMTCRMTP